LKLKDLGIIADFCFIQDRSGPTKEYINELKPLNNLFVGIYTDYKTDIDSSWKFTPEIAESLNANKYFIAITDDFQKDIINNPLHDNGRSVIFSAMQFLLWCEPKEIYLVGCDCTTNRFNNTKSGINPEYTISFWKKIKNFANLNYPNIEIYSINPVGLKGVFKEYEHI
jgi:hypothetical protein